MGRPEDLYQRNTMSKRVHRQYPETYSVAAMTDCTFLVAEVAKGAVASLLSDFSGADESLPGKAI
jgi:hypothetical protein